MEEKEFSDDTNRVIHDVGLAIYTDLKAKYPDNNGKSVDVMMNTLCASLTFLLRLNVKEEYRDKLIEVIKKILKQNC